METAILARHGESEFSVRGAVNGDPRTPCPLTVTGVEQAKRLGERLAGERIDLCVTTQFERVKETAALALDGRDIPRLVLPELNDIRFGSYEGKQLSEFRHWAAAHDPTVEAPGGGESRVAIAWRFVRGYRAILGRAERTILVVAHGLPIRYVLNALEAADPAPVVEQVPYAEPFHLSPAELELAVERLEAWAMRPRWPASDAG